MVCQSETIFDSVTQRDGEDRVSSRAPEPSVRREAPNDPNAIAFLSDLTFMLLLKPLSNNKKTKKDDAIGSNLRNKCEIHLGLAWFQSRSSALSNRHSSFY